MKIGIYGGTFNPPHLGHLAAARTAMDALKLDKLLLMPAAIPPHKVLPADSPSKEHRLAMVEIMADSMNLPGRVEVSSLEMDGRGKVTPLILWRPSTSSIPMRSCGCLWGPICF